MSRKFRFNIFKMNFADRCKLNNLNRVK